MGILDEEYKFYKDNQDTLMKQYRGRVLIIVGKEVVGEFNNEAAAYNDAVSRYRLGTFLIQKCVPEAEIIQSFHSRVIFN